MKKESVLIVALICLIAGGLSACARKQCPPCQPSFGTTQYAPQAASAPADESMISRRAGIK